MLTKSLKGCEAVVMPHKAQIFPTSEFPTLSSKLLNVVGGRDPIGLTECCIYFLPLNPAGPTVRPGSLFFFFFF